VCRQSYYYRHVFVLLTMTGHYYTDGKEDAIELIRQPVYMHIIWNCIYMVWYDKLSYNLFFVTAHQGSCEHKKPNILSNDERIGSS
jgi:hypothetical protein